MTVSDITCVRRWPTITLCLGLLSILITAGACGGTAETSHDSEPAGTLAEPEPAYTPEPTWQFVTAVSGTGGSFPTLEAASDALGKAANTKAESDRFHLSGGPVKLKYRVRGRDGLIYMMVAMENVATGEYGQGGGSLDLETDFSNSGSVRLQKEAGRYVIYVGSANCSWELEVWEKK